MTAKSNELICTVCGREALLLRKPVYEGFKKTGESLTCSCCGHVYADEESVPFKVKREPSVFSEADRPRPVQVFNEGENQTLCRYCAHYVVNPFMQWCSFHKKEVAATDTCTRFEQKEVSEEE
ncbi:MAG: hypothetical protein PHG65_09135 [Kiritimatiellae bacterium]|nr:hypothetical protein [Kiritimatiellia bacterium]